MVFVCPPKDEAERSTQITTKLKEVMQEVENMLAINVKPICVPCCVPLMNLPQSLEQPNNQDCGNDVFDPPAMMVCYREPSKHMTGSQRHEAEETGRRVKRSKSRELRASILYTGCYCERRDGLQDDCPRTGCHGSPECLTKPPTCGPSEFCDGKHLGRKNKNGNGKNGKRGENGNGDKSPKVRYKCFPASLASEAVPVCCTPCCKNN